MTASLWSFTMEALLIRLSHSNKEASGGPREVGYSQRGRPRLPFMNAWKTTGTSSPTPQRRLRSVSAHLALSKRQIVMQCLLPSKLLMWAVATLILQQTGDRERQTGTQQHWDRNAATAVTPWCPPDKCPRWARTFLFGLLSRLHAKLNLSQLLSHLWSHLGDGEQQKSSNLLAALAAPKRNCHFLSHRNPCTPQFWGADVVLW